MPAGWLIVAMIPNSYESKARIYVDVDDVLSEQLGIAGDGKEEIMRVRQTLVSAVNLKKVISSTKLGEGITETGQDGFGDRGPRKEGQSHQRAGQFVRDRGRSWQV